MYTVQYSQATIELMEYANCEIDSNYIPILTGLGNITYKEKSPDSIPIVFLWKASPESLGYYITIVKDRKHIGDCQGSTFNLALEIAAAAYNLL